ncbi:MAG: ClbS/DfsB family four-helix bundle protein [Candidatus Rokuibacteriota bacterium]
MTDKATVLHEAGLAFTELHGAIDGLTDEEMGRVWLGTWGVREILIHIAGWHDEMAAALDRVAKGDAPYPAGTYDDFDAWNARFVDRKAGMKTADVLTEVDASHRRLIGAAAALPEPLFVPGGAARDPVEGAAAGHYREHAAQIRQWRRK